MFRRKRIRRQLLSNSMDIDMDGGSGVVDHSKPLKPSKNENEPTNIEVLTDKLQKFSIKALDKERTKKKKPKYIDTSKLLNFKR